MVRYCTTCSNAAGAARRAAIAADPIRAEAQHQYFRDYYLAHPRT